MALVEVHQLTKSFGGLVANDRISFTVDAGMIMGIIGPNGFGKTTLFNCVSGFYAPSAGRVLLDGHDIAGYPPHRICRLGLARTFQIAEIFTRMTVLENAMVGAFKRDKRLGPAKEMAMASLGLVGLSSQATAPSKRLSPPERRKLSLAMALATDPRVLLLDETMAGLLPEEIAEILDLIRRIQQGGMTILLIEHVMDAMLNIAERIVVLEAGKVIAIGGPEEVSNNDRVITAYLGAGYRHA